MKHSTREEGINIPDPEYFFTKPQGLIRSGMLRNRATASRHLPPKSLTHLVFEPLVLSVANTMFAKPAWLRLDDRFSNGQIQRGGPIT